MTVGGGSLNLPTHIKSFIIIEEKHKLKKLPPDRVGANFDHSSSTSAGWLPSFGRVWNNGRRWQSRYGPEPGAQPASSSLGRCHPFVLLTPSSPFRHQFKTEAAARNKQQPCQQPTPASTLCDCLTWEKDTPTY